MHRRSRGHNDSANDASMLSERDMNNVTAMDTTTTNSIERTFSPHSLAKKLDEVKEQIKEQKIDDLELMDFDHENTEDVDVFLRKRDEVREKVAGDNIQFDANGRTALNLENAAIAGAKMLVDEQKMTRSMSRKLLNECGINEDDVLYKGLRNDKTEKEAAMDVKSHRQSSVVESFVDFQKQLQFKMHVLEGVAAKNHDELAKSEASRRLTRKRQMEEDEENKKKLKAGQLKRKGAGGSRKQESTSHESLFPATPANTKTINPLDCHRIIENYALEVASEVREDTYKRRRIAPVPFNLNLLDSDGEE